MGLLSLGFPTDWLLIKTTCIYHSLAQPTPKLIFELTTRKQVPNITAFIFTSKSMGTKNKNIFLQITQEIYVYVILCHSSDETTKAGC